MSQSDDILQAGVDAMNKALVKNWVIEFSPNHDPNNPFPLKKEGVIKPPIKQFDFNDTLRQLFIDFKYDHRNLGDTMRLAKLLYYDDPRAKEIVTKEFAELQNKLKKSQ